MTLRARADDPVERRRIHRDLRASLTNPPWRKAVSLQLPYVIWELLTNLDRVTIPPEAEVTILVLVLPPRVSLRLPGPPFDSVSAAELEDSRGLRTAAARLRACGCRWSHSYSEEHNEILIEGDRA